MESRNVKHVTNPSDISVCCPNASGRTRKIKKYNQDYLSEKYFILTEDIVKDLSLKDFHSHAFFLVSYT
jgi:hypothetical protein